MPDKDRADRSHYPTFYHYPPTMIDNHDSYVRKAIKLTKRKAELHSEIDDAVKQELADGIKRMVVPLKSMIETINRIEDNLEDKASRTNRFIECTSLGIPRRYREDFFIDITQDCERLRQLTNCGEFRVWVQVIIPQCTIATVKGLWSVFSGLFK